MIAFHVTRVVLYTLAIALLGFAVIRFVGVVPDGEGGGCGPGFTFDFYEGACDAALKARQYEVVTEIVLAAVVVLMARLKLREDVRRAD